MYVLLISLIIPLLSFMLQSYPRVFNRFFGVDVWTRLIEIDHVKKAKHKIPGKITKGFIIDGYFDYPILFPWIFSFFPKQFLFKAQGFISPIFDCLQTIFLFYLSINIFHNIPLAILSQIIYATIPMIPVENSYLTPRSLGYFFFTLSFTPLLFFTTAHNTILLLISVIFATLLFLTHRFALQSFIFICIFFSIFERSFVYVIVPIFSFLCATVLTNGYYLRVGKGHLANIYFWVINYKYRFIHQIYGTSKIKKLDWVGKIYSMLSTFSPIFLIGIDSWVISGFVYLYLHTSSRVQANPIFYKMCIWLLFFYVLGAVVLRIKKLIPIGEGQRYLEMATIPTAILSTYLYSYFSKINPPLTLFMFLAVIAGNLGLILLIQIKAIIKDKNRSLTKELKDAYKFINKMKKVPRIICIPHAITTMTVYNTKAEVLVNADNPGLLKIMDIYPLLKIPIEKLKKDYKLTHLLLLESFAKTSSLKLKRKKVIYRSNDVLVIAL